MLNTPFTPWPAFTEEEADAVQRVLLSNRVNYWTGSECREFEKEFAAWSGSRYAIALANGTVALDLALKALGIGSGDEVIVTPRTFIASASCVVNAGATPVFADVDRDSGNITAETVSAVVTNRTKAVICVHLAGWPCDMDSILDLASQYNLKIIEDCAQAHGAHYKGRSVGSIGDIGAWSFCQDKIMTTGGEGGMITTNDKELWSKMWSYKDHGKAWEAVYDEKPSSGFRWVHESFGTNWRMTEMEGAIGRIQLRNMPGWSAARRSNSVLLDSACGKFKALRVPRTPNYIEHARYKYYAYIRPEFLKEDWTRDRIVTQINENDVPCYQGACSEVYLEKAFDGTGHRPSKRLQVARSLGETSLMFLVHPTLTEIELSKTCDVITDVFSRASQ